MNMIYGIILMPSALSICVIAMYWRSLARIGFVGEVVGRAPNMLIFDLMAIYAALMVGYWSLHAWTGHALTVFPSAPQTDAGTLLAALACFFALVMILRLNAGDRFTTPTVAGIREAAVRSLLTLRIIDHAEDVFRSRVARRNV
ncbi:hypothetical protein EBB59_01530 [Lysobacter pythonis]|uniref:Uncharacterized protein n=1 Tax=Solilutibacter pythonis TaxID=2483112 RepID=A0A3M2I7Y8_9GAMM|nr:hypothetical protein [Lysobacter pythonis]RMH94404.1 hypothetical protein EBB59_01530 [Lysobacter pythonis]